MTNELTIQREMNPANWELIKSIAETTAIAKSEQSKIAKHLLFCFENDLPLSLAVNGGLYTVDGRVGVEGTVIRAQIRKHPDYDYVIKDLSENGCTIAITMHGEILGEASFGSEDAKLAGLLDKNNYKFYPTDMYLNRATSRAYKRFCPDIFMQSVYVRGEISDHDAGVNAIEVDGVIIPSIGEMIEADPQGVLDAINNTDGSQRAVYDYIHGGDDE